MTQLSLLRQRVISYFSAFSATTTAGSQERVYSESRSSFSPRKMKRYFRKSIYVQVGAIVVVLAFVILVIRIVNAHRYTQVPVTTTQSVLSTTPTATETLNKSYTFPLTDVNGNTISNFTYNIQGVQEQNQILIKGETASAVAGTTFLIVNLKITNNFTKSFSLNTRDYVRLMMNNTSDRLAPELYNDPVEVQAISTTFTKVGFPIPTNAKDLELQVGQITGKKSSINLSI